MGRTREVPRIRDVARASGFSVATASRALNPATASVVSVKTREVIEATAAALGYQPNDAARSLRTSRSMIIGVVIPDITNPLFPRVVRGIDDKLRSSNYYSLLANSDSDPVRAEDATRRLLQRGVDGLIIATASLEDRGPTLLERDDIPLVLLNRRTKDARLPSVTAAGLRGTTDALSWLLDQGHRDITVLAAPQHTSTGRERLKEVEQAAKKKLGRRLPAVTAEAVSEEAGYRATAAALQSQKTPPTAIIAANDLLALGAIRALQDHGLRCPQDVSVVGFNDMPFSDRMNPPLSTIGFDHYTMGTEAARLVLELVNGQDKVKSVHLPTEWIRRGSTAPVAARK